MIDQQVLCNPKNREKIKEKLTPESICLIQEKAIKEEQINKK